jgi:hypothetical protein
MMQSEISIHLNRESADVQRGVSLGGSAHWITLQCEEGRNSADLTVFGTPAQLDAFIDRVTALRSTPDPLITKLVGALRRALGMPDDSSDMEVLLRASIAELEAA